jgi:hypothetical protein
MMCWRALLLPLLLLASALQAAEDWHLARHDDSRDIQVYTRAVPGSAYDSFYAVTHVNAHLSSVVAMLSDVSAMPEWITRMKSARLLKRQADSDVWIYSVYKLPYPFMEREAVLHSTLKQDKDGVVEVLTQAEPGFVPSNPKRVRLLDMQGKWRLTPEKNGVIKIEMWGAGAPGGYMPALLFNYGLPNEPAKTLRHLRQMLTRDKYQAKKLPYIHEP